MTKSTALAQSEPATGSVISPAEMIGQAIASNSGPEVMEKLLALQERWDARNAKMEFDKAIADLRSDLPEIIKDRSGYGYEYEDLPAIIRAVSQPMSDRGLSFRWRTSSDKDGVHVTCIIAHRDGHAEETSLTSAPDTSGSKNDIQAIGSAVTYLQRYTLKAALGIAASHDDDGQATRQTSKAKPKAQSRGDFSTYEAALREAKTVEDLADYWENGIDWNAVPKDWKPLLIEEKDSCLAALKAAKAEATKKGKAPAESLDDQFPGDIDPEFKRMAEGTRV